MASRCTAVHHACIVLLLLRGAVAFVLQTIAQVTTLSLYMRPCIIIKEVLSQMCYIINEHWKQYRLSRNRADVAATNLASNNYAGSGTLQDGVSSPLKWADCPKVFVSARIIVA